MAIIMFLVIVLGLSFVLTSLLSTFRNHRPMELDNSSLRVRISRYGGLVGGLGLIGAVVLGTLQDVGKEYKESAEIEALSIRWPSVESEGDDAYLVHTILAEQHGSDYRAIQVKSRVMEGSGSLPRVSHRENGMRLSANLSMSPSERGGFSVEGEVRIHQTSFQSMQGINRRVQPGDFSKIGFMSSRTGSSFLSLNRSPSTRYAVLLLMQPVAADDPCTEISFDTALATTNGWPQASAQPAAIRNAPPMPGFAYAYHVGRASVTLLVAGFLMTMFFRRRSMALPLVLFFTLVVCISVDRWMLGVHVERMQDDSQSLAVRATAARNLEQTFFFGETATNAARLVIDDDASPEGVRAYAEEAINVIWARQQVTVPD